MYKIGKVYYETLVRVRGQDGGLNRQLTWKKIGPKVCDGRRSVWRDKEGQDNQVRL